MTSAAPKAKNFVLIPSKSDKALVIRRGPAKQVGLFQWDLKSHKMKESQWLKGRIYEYFSDISADGKHFFYSANKNGDAYTVLSQSPWLKAISFWRNVGGRGGGLLIDNNRYILYDGAEAYNSFRDDKWVAAKNGREVLREGVYPARLIRDGWKLIETTKYQLTFIKPLGKNKSIQKIWHRWNISPSSNKPCFWEEHKLIFDSQVFEKPDWEWCELYKDLLLWSQSGCIYRAMKSDIAHIEAPLVVYDFNDSQFQEMAAPY